jgi:hypothetical protein
MGAGAVYRLPGSDTTVLESLHKPVDGQVCSLRPEAEALLLLLQTIPAQEPAVVFTDSQSLLDSLLTHYLRSGCRRALASPHRAHIRAIVDVLTRRTGATRLVKVKSHMGMPLNAAADAQADLGAEADPTTSSTIATVTMSLQFRPRPSLLPPARLQALPTSRAQDVSPPLPDPVSTPAAWTGIRSEAKKLVSRSFRQRLDDITLARPSVFTDFVRRGECVLPILGQTHKLTGAQCRMWYQLTAGIYPTQAYLARIGLALSDRCEFCLEERETPGHFTNRCCAFHDTRTKGHNDAWATTTDAIRAKLPVSSHLYRDVPMKEVPVRLGRVRWEQASDSEGGGRTEIWDAERLGSLQPDAVVVDTARKTICVLEYTRPSDSRMEALYEAAARKTDKYLVLHAALSHHQEAGWQVSFFPLPVGVRGSLLQTHWSPALEALGVPQTNHRGILRTAATASVQATHLLHLCRHKRRKTPETVGLRYKVREYAKESWGPLPPPI